MINGKKPVDSASQHKTDNSVTQRRLAATFVFFVVMSFIVVTAYWLARTPPSGIIAMRVSKTYINECSDCHEIYHPSLLPAASWRKLITHLDEHFGEDASLDHHTAGNIARYLYQFSAEKWNTEAANRLRIVDKANPFQITATPYWQYRHANIDNKIFSAIGGKGRCSACHNDAATGLFADAKIELPKLKQKPKGPNGS